MSYLLILVLTLALLLIFVIGKSKEHMDTNAKIAAIVVPSVALPVISGGGLSYLHGKGKIGLEQDLHDVMNKHSISDKVDVSVQRLHNFETGQVSVHKVPVNNFSTQVIRQANQGKLYPSDNMYTALMSKQIPGYKDYAKISGKDFSKIRGNVGKIMNEEIEPAYNALKNRTILSTIARGLGRL